MAGGSWTVEQAGPELPADISLTMPAARWAWTAASRVPGEHPSEGGQVQELTVTSGARVGSPWPGFPPTGYRGRENSKHSIHVVGVPVPPSMFRQPIHLAPGAMPTWLTPPFSVSW